MKPGWLGAIGLLAGAWVSAGAVDYLREVKPVLAEHCYRCHGASQQKASLRLDTAVFAQQGGERGSAIQAGKPAESLMVQVIKGTHAEIARMPYKQPQLAEAQIAAIAEWIQEGAQAPAHEEPERKKHWAFEPPIRVAPPSVRHPEWVRNAIDQFILARLENANLQPAPEADRTTLIRRLSLDLIGLPPSPAEVDAFVTDQDPKAWEHLVERLLGSVHYGERWGRLWLDVARYADSNGYSIDAPRSIWKYRDWVIAALNRDQPFNQFVIEQLAGDLLPHASVAQRIATGFHRNTQINQEGGIDPEQFRVESVLDRVNTTGTAFLGLTVACAQCHDHKFDPISQKEYYQLFAFFNNTVEDGHGKGAPEGMLDIPGETEALENLQKDLEEAEADLDRYLDTKGSEVVKWEQELAPEQAAKLKPETRRVLTIPFAERTPKQKRLIYAAFRPEDNDFKTRNAKLSKLEKRLPKPVTTLVMIEQPQPRESFVFIKGDFTRRGPAVTPGVPAILHPLNRTTDATNSTPNRLDLARWIVDPKNPLTARVMVNRIWQQYFGRGLVETENDFGTQGAPPTHPELLDWLATELIAHSWSLKAMHRLIVTSATYRQSSRVRPELALVDPYNKLLARQSRLRLDAEIVRDVALAASGLLNDKVGGPSVFPPQPDGVMKLGQVKRDWKPSSGPDRYRRGLYTFFWRATPHPALAVFDAADGFSACTRRLRSNTPLQGLTLLNSTAHHEFAQALAKRALATGASSEAERVQLAFRYCVARPPSPEETERLLALLHQEQTAFQQAPNEAAAVFGQKAESADLPQLAAWTTLSRVLLNLDETMTRD